MVRRGDLESEEFGIRWVVGECLVRWMVGGCNRSMLLCIETSFLLYL